jgi:hypothetical protein
MEKSNEKPKTAHQVKYYEETDIGDPTDGRRRWDWISKWDPIARREIKWEGCFLFVIFLFSVVFLFMTWQNWISSWLSHSPEESLILRRYSFYSASGMLGGITFGIKYFYRVVARGWWHQDRRFWRFMSPFIAMIVALVVGSMIDAGLIVVTAQNRISTPAIISIGFLAGYFADEAVGKMYEVASVLFGRSDSIKSNVEQK